MTWLLSVSLPYDDCNLMTLFQYLLCCICVYCTSVCISPSCSGVGLLLTCKTMTFNFEIENVFRNEKREVNALRSQAFTGAFPCTQSDTDLLKMDEWKNISRGY